MTFWESSFLWQEAVIASAVLGAAGAVTGLYTIFRRVVFLPAALSQFSGLGVMIAFALTAAMHAEHQGADLLPHALAFVLTFGGAIALGWVREGQQTNRETLIGITYIVATALTIVIADSIPQESHHVGDILFGNAIVVTPAQMWVAVSTSIAVLLVHAIYTKRFLFISFDEQTALAHGLPVKRLSVLLFLTLGLTIAVTTRTIGALPAFAFSVLPGFAAMRLAKKSRVIFLNAAGIGAFSAFAGYWCSFSFNLPTGACTTCVLFLIALMAGTKQLFSFKRSHRQ